MAFQFEGFCCEMTRARVSAAKYDDLISGKADLIDLGDVLKVEATPVIKTAGVPNRRDTTGGFSCSNSSIEKIELSMTVACQKASNKEYFLGASRYNSAGSIAGAPKTWWTYLSKSNSAAGEKRLVSLSVPVDARASGSDAFKIEGYAVAATPVIWNKSTNTTTPASPVVTALVSGVDYTPIYSPDGTLITAVEIFMSSTKFTSFTNFSANAVNLKFTGKTFDYVEFAQFKKSQVELYVAWAGETVSDNKNYFVSGAFFKVKFEVAPMTIINENDEFVQFELKGEILNVPQFEYQRPDLSGPNSESTKPYGFLVNQTS